MDVFGHLADKLVQLVAELCARKKPADVRTIHVRLRNHCRLELVTNPSIDNVERLLEHLCAEKRLKKVRSKSGQLTYSVGNQEKNRSLASPSPKHVSRNLLPYILKSISDSQGLKIKRELLKTSVWRSFKEMDESDFERQFQLSLDHGIRSQLIGVSGDSVAVKLNWRHKLAPAVVDDGIAETTTVDEPEIRRAKPLMLCGFCMGSIRKNRLDVAEPFVSCIDCGHSAHPSCAFPDSKTDLRKVVLDLPWQCLECKQCLACDHTEATHDFVLCDGCDRGFHFACCLPPIRTAPRGRWFCDICEHRPRADQLLAREPKVPSVPLEYFESEDALNYMKKIGRIEKQRARAAELAEKSKSLIKGSSSVNKDLVLMAESCSEPQPPTSSSAGDAVDSITSDLQPHTTAEEASEESFQQEDLSSRIISNRAVKGLIDHLSNFFTPSSSRKRRIDLGSVGVERKRENSNASTSNAVVDATDASELKSGIEYYYGPNWARSSSATARKSQLKDLTKSQVVYIEKLFTNMKARHERNRLRKKNANSKLAHMDVKLQLQLKRKREASRKRGRPPIKLKIRKLSAAESSASSENAVSDTDADADNDLDEDGQRCSSSRTAAAGYRLRQRHQSARLRQGLIATITRADREMLERAQRMAKRSVGAQRLITGERMPAMIQIGRFEIDTWYSSPYPQEYASLKKLFLCEYCLKYLKSRAISERHMNKCALFWPPGNEIYRHDGLRIFEVDGNVQKIYCQNLCLLARLFLHHKTLYYDVEPFLFYVLVKYDEQDGFSLIGYFSKEKHCPQKYNVSCIMILPPYQCKGYGRFLIDFSYLLSRAEGQPGTPERPLSDLGRISYMSYWRSTVVRIFYDQPLDRSTSIKDLMDKTGMTKEDVVETLQELDMLVADGSGSFFLKIDVDKLKQMVERIDAKPAIQLNEAALQWSPYVSDRFSPLGIDIYSPLYGPPGAFRSSVGRGPTSPRGRQLPSASSSTSSLSLNSPVKLPPTLQSPNTAIQVTSPSLPIPRRLFDGTTSVVTPSGRRRSTQDRLLQRVASMPSPADEEQLEKSPKRLRFKSPKLLEAEYSLNASLSPSPDKQTAQLVTVPSESEKSSRSLRKGRRRRGRPSTVEMAVAKRKAVSRREYKLHDSQTVLGPVRTLLTSDGQFYVFCTDLLNLVCDDGNTTNVTKSIMALSEEPAPYPTLTDDCWVFDQTSKCKCVSMDGVSQLLYKVLPSAVLKSWVSVNMKKLKKLCKFLQETGFVVSELDGDGCHVFKLESAPVNSVSSPTSAKIVRPITLTVTVTVEKSTRSRRRKRRRSSTSDEAVFGPSSSSDLSPSPRNVVVRSSVSTRKLRRLPGRPKDISGSPEFAALGTAADSGRLKLRRRSSLRSESANSVEQRKATWSMGRAISSSPKQTCLTSGRAESDRLCNGDSPLADQTTDSASDVNESFDEALQLGHVVDQKSGLLPAVGQHCSRSPPNGYRKNSSSAAGMTSPRKMKRRAPVRMKTFSKTDRQELPKKKQVTLHDMWEKADLTKRAHCTDGHGQVDADPTESPNNSAEPVDSAHCNGHLTGSPVNGYDSLVNGVSDEEEASDKEHSPSNDRLGQDPLVMVADHLEPVNSLPLNALLSPSRTMTRCKWLSEAAGKSFRRPATALGHSQ